MSATLPSSKYSIELAQPNGTTLAELSGRAKDRQFTLIRNSADAIQWTLDLDEFEHYCRATNQDPRQVLITNNTEVRIKRYGTYLAAGQLNYKEGTLTADSSGNTLQIRAQGFLGLFSTRYTTFNGAGQVLNPGSTDDQYYENMDASQIAWALINTSQTGGNDSTNTTTPAYWDYGITQGTLAVVGNHTRDYQDMSILDAINDFNNVAIGGFDCRIGYDKVFNTYAQLGVQRPDIVFQYPGNIINADMVEDGTQVANYIIAQGAGNGNVALQDFTAASEGSASQYFYRQEYVTPSSLDTDDDSLSDYAEWMLNQYKTPFVLPTIQVNCTASGIAPTDFDVGDWVRIIITNHPLYADVNGMYRVEQLQVSVDAEDNEIMAITTSLT